MSNKKYSCLNCNATRAFFSEDKYNKYTTLDRNELCTLINYLIDNIYVKFGSYMFRQSIGIPMGTDCAPLLADLFLHHYEYNFMQSMIKSNIVNARKFNYTFRYIDDLQSQNNPNFAKYVSDIYPPELELKETTKELSRLETLDVQRPVSYLDILFFFDKNGVLSYKLYDKRDDFNFSIVNFPYICSNIPSGPAYGIYISQLVRYSRVCLVYDDFCIRHIELVRRLMSQGYKINKLRKTFNRFYDNYTSYIRKYHRNKDEMAADAELFNVGCDFGQYIYGLFEGGV